MKGTANELALTDLEKDLLTRFYERYASVGFPACAEIKVRSRENTGAGRFTYLDHNRTINIVDGQLALGKFGQVNMDRLPAGASFWLEVENGKLSYLEIAVNGDYHWDGAEGHWIICDPETGKFS